MYMVTLRRSPGLVILAVQDTRAVRRDSRFVAHVPGPVSTNRVGQDIRGDLVSRCGCLGYTRSNLASNRTNRNRIIDCLLT